MAAVLGAASLLMGHFVWVGPVMAPLKVGEVAQIQIGNTDYFPDSDGPIPLDGLKVWAVGPVGAKVDVAVTPSEKFLRGTFPVKEAGVYKIVFTQERGVISKTPKGFKPGGRGQHPDATLSYRPHRTGLSYAATAGKALGREKALGLPFEIVPEKTAEGFLITVLAEGKPVEGATIGAAWPGKEHTEEGKTGPDGKFLFKLAAGTKGPLLLLADHKTPAPKGASYDTENWSATLALYW